MHGIRFLPLLLILLCGCLWVPLQAQQSDTLRLPGREEAPRVFLDCADDFCDFDFFRTEIPFAIWVRDRRDAQIHVLITAQPTGGGGREFTLGFLGQQRFAGTDQRLRHISRATETADEVRRGLARMLSLGLVPYVTQTPLAERLEISYRAAETEQGATDTPRDPWNFWTFRVGVHGNLNGESSYRSSSLATTLSADRVTESWKSNTSLYVQREESSFEVEDQTIRSLQRSYSGHGQLVRSLGSHWSAGARAFAISSTFYNQQLVLRLGPAIEYNLFPYSEATRRQLTFQYSVGGINFDYREETIFGRSSETLLDQRLVTALSLNQPWGSLNSALEASQYLPRADKYRLVFFNGLNVRLFRGFEVEMYGSASLIRDQIYLAARGASPEEILLRQRGLATSYEYFASVGLSYTFGSIFNDVVNPRFPR